MARKGQLGRVFKQISNHLNMMMNCIGRKEPVFFDTYSNAFAIIKLGSGRKKVKIAEVFEKGFPIFGVVLERR